MSDSSPDNGDARILPEGRRAAAVRSPKLLLAIATRFEDSSRAINGFSYGQQAVIRDMRMPGDLNDALYRGPVMDREAYRDALLVARMRYALEICP